MAMAQMPTTDMRSVDLAVRDEARRVMDSLAPWGMSIVFHVGLVLLAVFLAWQGGRREDVLDPRTVPTLVDIPAYESLTTGTRSVTSGGTRTSRSVNTPITTKPVREIGLTGANLSNAVHGIGAFGTGTSGRGGGPFGAAISPGQGMGGGMFGVPAHPGAKKIVYLIDASGSLITTFPFVVLELKRAILSLKEQQSFTVIFFQGDEVREIGPRGLKRADKAGVDRFMKWVDPAAGNIIPAGATNPVKALQLAMKYEPDLIMLLSDNITGAGTGRFEIDQRRLLKMIREGNTRKTQINTIQFSQRDPLSIRGLRGTMEEISRQSGGIYRYIGETELMLR